MPHRTPIEKRIIYKALPIGKPHTINLDVDGNDWKVCVQLVVFKTDEKNVTYHLSNMMLTPPLENMVARLKHNFPDIKLTEKKLLTLIKTSITRGIYEQGKRDEATIFLTLDSWLKLHPKNIKSQLVTTTPSVFRRLFKNEE